MKRLTLVLAAASLGVLAGLYFVNRARRHGVDTVSAGGQPASLSVSASATPTDEVVAKAAPPRFEVKSGSPVQTDPDRPDYDPIKLSDLGRSMKDIFEAEPRNARWAGPMESLLEKRLAGDLPVFTERGKVAGIECRSSSCLVQVDAPFEDLHRVTFGLQYPPLGDAFSPSTSEQPIETGWHRHTVHILYGPQNRDVRALPELDRRRRKLGLKVIRDAHQVVAELGIDPSKLPPIDPEP